MSSMSTDASFDDTAAIILAAGKSTRMNGDMKVLCTVDGKPLIHYLLDTLSTLGIQQPIVVVGYKQSEVRAALAAYDVRFVDQGEAKGTGHAVQAAEPAVDPSKTRSIICYGDTPFLSAASMRAIAATLDVPSIMCGLVTTARTPHTDRFGRVYRNERNEVKAIVEFKNATDEERRMNEVNAGGYCARLPWLWRTLARITPNPVTNEYYLTDIAKLAIADGERVVPVMVPPEEAYGIDTRELLEFVRRAWRTGSDH